MTDRVEFTVIGRPEPGGSKKQVPIRQAGKPTRFAVVDDNKKAKPWQALVRAAAAEAMGDHDLLVGPLVLEIDFYLARPAGHYGSGRNAGVVKRGAPPYPITRPDTTKLTRALEDALTGLVWHNDAQVVSQLCQKWYGHPERADVTVRIAYARMQNGEGRLEKVRPGVLFSDGPGGALTSV